VNLVLFIHIFLLTKEGLGLPRSNLIFVNMMSLTGELTKEELYEDSCRDRSQDRSQDIGRLATKFSEQDSSLIRHQRELDIKETKLSEQSSALTHVSEMCAQLGDRRNTVQREIDEKTAVLEDLKDVIEKGRSEQHEVYLELLNNERIVAEKEEEIMAGDRDFIFKVTEMSDALLRARTRARIALKLDEMEEREESDHCQTQSMSTEA